MYKDVTVTYALTRHMVFELHAAAQIARCTLATAMTKDLGYRSMLLRLRDQVLETCLQTCEGLPATSLLQHSALPQTHCGICTAGHSTVAIAGDSNCQQACTVAGKGWHEGTSLQVKHAECVVGPG